MSCLAGSSASETYQASFSGYFLNFKKGHAEWEEKSLDYDELSTDLTNLACGTFYSFNIMAHNIAGRSKPSATLTTNTLGSIPDVASKERLLTGERFWCDF